MTYCKLNGISFDVDVAIAEYKRKLNILNGENAGRVMSGDMILDPIGAYLGREVTFFRKGNNYKALDDLWSFLVEHSIDREGISVEVADGQTTISYQAYYGDTEQMLEKVDDGINYWGDIKLSIIPMKAQVKPR